MYSALWSPRLRQGDILSKVPFPVTRRQINWTLEGTLGGLTDVITQQLVPMPVKTELRDVMVISHDCEFNEGKRSHFLIARIEPISKLTPANELAILRASNDIQRVADNQQPSYLDSFHLESLEGILSEFTRVNFTAITSFPMNAVGDMLRVKVAELDHQTRVLLRRKLGVFFGRDEEDLLEEQKRDPGELRKEWQAEAGPPAGAG